jgi:hypothetical protein
MPMEQETLESLINGFSFIMSIMFVVVLLLMIRRKTYRVAYGLTLCFLLFFSWAVMQALKAIRFDVNHPMASEEISLHLGIAGVLWAISMIFLLAGLINFSSRGKNKEDIKTNGDFVETK